MGWTYVPGPNIAAGAEPESTSNRHRVANLFPCPPIATPASPAARCGLLMQLDGLRTLLPGRCKAALTRLLVPRRSPPLGAHHWPRNFSSLWVGCCL
jgi:hypothetical protein